MKSWIAGGISVFVVIAAGVFSYIILSRTPVETDTATNTEIDLENVVAIVNGKSITKDNVLALADYKNLIITDPDLERDVDLVNELIEELVRQQLLVDEAKHLRLDRDKKVMSALSLAQNQVLADIVLQKTVEPSIREKELIALYKEDKRKLSISEEVWARHILVTSKEQADLLSVKLKAGMNFSDLAERVSIDPATAAKGGDLGYFTRSDMAKTFSDIVFSLRVGAISEPFKTRYGWHIVKIEDFRRLESPTFEEARPRLLRYQTYVIIEELLKKLRQDAVIEYIREKTQVE